MPFVAPPNRTTALERLAAFVPKSGSSYARLRNYDLPDQGHPHVSGLSPYLRHRLITEDEVLTAVLGRFSASTADKFIQEVYWRTYWKGWLEMRPAVWTAYQAALRRALDDVQTQSGLRRAWEDACTGQTGIDGFDAWARELVDTGYLHNHARMWFASIWIFTLRLPWVLGADFFLRHLLDGDPASNTLSWRWVGGLQTAGKTYLARPDNIAKYTDGRIASASSLAHIANPLPACSHPDPRPIPSGGTWTEGRRTGLLLTDEDLSPAFLFHRGLTVSATQPFHAVDGLSPLAVAPHVSAFVTGGLDDVTTRWRDRLGGIAPLETTADAVLDWARRESLDQIVTPYAPVGPTAAALAEIRTHAGDDLTLHQIQRPFDAAAWPHSTHGFFRFKKQIPRLLSALRNVQAA